MSLAEIERFTADLKSNATLRAEAEKSQAEKSQTTPLARSVAFANSKGYGFTIEHAKEHLKAKAAASGKPLTDAELDGLAGGRGGTHGVIKATLAAGGGAIAGCFQSGVHIVVCTGEK